MLRARVWRDRNNRYVCDLCRRKLSPHVANTLCRPSLYHDARIATAVSPGTATAPGSRHLSTTRSLYKPNGNSKPNPPGGGFGGGFGGFGSFANKEVSSSSGLLPHEKAAKAAQNGTPPPRPPPRNADAEPKPEAAAQSSTAGNNRDGGNFSEASGQSGQYTQHAQQRQAQNPRRNRQPDPAMKARSDESTAKSRETLQQLFDKARARPPPSAQQSQPTPPPAREPGLGRGTEDPRPTTGSTIASSRPRGTPEASTSSRQNQASGGWGAFSGRQSTIQQTPERPAPPPPSRTSPSQEKNDNTSKSKGSQADRNGWGAFSGRQSTVRTTPEPSSFQPAFGGRQVEASSGRASSQPASASRTPPAPPKKEPAPVVQPAGDDFWDAIEGTTTKSRPTEQSRPVPKAAPAPVKPADDSFWDQIEGKPQQPKYTAPPEEVGVPKPTTKPEPRAEGGFWDEFEGRMGHSRDRRSREPRRQREYEPERKPEKQHKYTKRSEKKKMQNQQRSGRDEDDDDWDLSAARYERQKAKEERKRQQQEMGPIEEEGAIPIFLPEYVSVASLASSLGQKTDQFLADLEEFGFESMTTDTLMTGETASLIAMEYGFDPTVDDGSKRDLRPRPEPEDITSLPPRPPIVTIMGHVDHGKTTLLDYLRKSSVAAQEHGGITQHIGAFVVKMSSGKPITFLDTPGHAAFLTMRQRGANVTDIVVLVVAADDSVKPQTLEALKHAQTAQVPIIVAINKIDKDEARIDQVKADLARHGVEIEDYGGDVQVVCVSGKTGQGMEDLEENINTLSEILDTRSEPDGMAEGWILESSVKQDGKVATVLVKRGTLRIGDHILAGRSHARVRILRNEAGVEVTEAGPGTPVEILGWRDLPEAGEQVLQAPDESAVRTAIQYREEMVDRHESSLYIAQQEQKQREKEAREAAEAAAAEAEEAGEEAFRDEDGPKIIYQNFVVKADVAGSVEAVVASVQEQGNNEVQSKVLRSGTGQLSEYDVDHAATSNSVLVNFNNAILPHIKMRADQQGVRIVDHSVIYHLTDEVRSCLSDLLPKAISHKNLGEADILQIFPINIKGRKYRNIAGCRIRNGSIKKTSLVKVLRWGQVIYEGKIDTLKHVKKDVMEMSKGSECGIAFEDFEDFQVDDQVQTYQIVEEKRAL